MDNKAKLLQKAKAYAFLLLKFRLRSENEIYRRLKKKRFPEEVITKALEFLKEKGFIDDRVFTKAWIESRLKRPLGLRKIKLELNLKGIDKEIVDREISRVGENYCEADVVVKLARARLDKLKALDKESAKRRIYGYLLRRGYSPETVTDAINQLCKPTF